MPSTNSPQDRNRDPGRPTARLSDAEKQLVLVKEALEAESEEIDPDLIKRLEGTIEDVRTVDRELRMFDALVDEGVQ